PQPGRGRGPRRGLGGGLRRHQPVPAGPRQPDHGQPGRPPPGRARRGRGRRAPRPRPQGRAPGERGARPGPARGRRRPPGPPAGGTLAGRRAMSEQDRYTPEEWRTLQFAPFWMFSAVIGAYNRFDPRDHQAFFRCLEAATLADGRLRREVLASVLADRERLAERFRAEQRSIGVGLFQVDAVLAKAGPDEAVRFKDMLVLDIGEGVAR